MFQSHDYNSNKKKFQKPNILRKNGRFNNMTFNIQQEHKSEKIQLPKKIEHSTSQLSVNSYKETEEAVKNLSSVINNKFSESIPSPVNFEDFLNNGETGSQNNLLFDIDVTLSQDIEANNVEMICLDKSVVATAAELCSDYDKVQNGDHSTLESVVESTMFPLSAITSSNMEKNPQIEHDLVSPNPSLPYNFVFKCTVLNCNKEFMSKQRLNSHMKLHNKKPANKVPRMSCYDCPVKGKVNEDSTKCGRVFSFREDLVKHLNEEHTLEDGDYKCEACGRQFYWAASLRAHARVHARGPVALALACAWPGCGRVFRQPCRLREHTRKHTGDKPYPCNYPECGWSFRTASKLVRHARRHTGERRHACALCARAFLRREHLRDHAAKHLRTPTPCPHSHCDQKFYTVKSFNLHLKKAHREEDPETNLVDIVENTPFEMGNDDAFTVSLSHPEMSIEEGSLNLEYGMSESVEGRAARTHCTWPLPARAAPATETASAFVPATQSASASPTLLYDDAAVLEDVKVAQLEGAESNVYTIRSDLFLHSNVLYNEDSQSMPGAVEEGEGEGPEAAAGALDAELGLDAHAHDTHSTIDLMQEQLMFTDAAVDESSFRVFLLNGEELTL